MTDVGIGDLLVRMLVSLGVVLGVVFGAYVVIRRRQGFSASMPAPRQRRGMGRAPGAKSGGLVSLVGLAGRSSHGGTSKLVGNRRGLRVLGRVGVGRTSQVVAVQFAEKVFLVGASDTSAPNVLAELDLASWIEATETADADVSSLSGKDAAVVREPLDPHGVVTGVSPRPGLLDSLREATARRG
jgi:flagellar biogenesis protein FliO